VRREAPKLLDSAALQQPATPACSRAPMRPVVAALIAAIQFLEGHAC
jgi:hypothetical protein